MVLPLSTGQITEAIRKETGGDVNRDMVNYAILKAGIKPVGRAGLVRLFPQSAVDTVRAFLATKRRPSQSQSQSERTLA
jgi:hypothetical protein